MKAIIGERPNIKPVGIGNSGTEVDLTVLGPDVQDEESGPDDVETITLSECDDDETQGDSQGRVVKKKRSAFAAGLDEDVKPTIDEDIKPKQDEDVKPKLGTYARPNTSKPTATGSKPKKVKGIDDIVEIAMAEEVTRQKELELDVQRSKDKASRAQAKAEVKKAAIEAKKEKERQAHEMELAKMRLEFARFQHALPVGVGAQLNQDNIHLPTPFTPDLPFGGGQFGGAVNGGEDMGEGSFAA